MSEDVLILYSGGADSRLMLKIAKDAGKTPHCLLINYGQLHLNELDFAKNQLDSEGVKYSESTVFLDINSGLTGDGVKNETGAVHEMHVPGRNSIFLSLAFSVAESKDIGTIWIGADWSDRINLFPDCYQEYLVRMNDAFKWAGPKPIEIEAPLIGFTKEMVLATLKTHGVKESELFSGYGEVG